MRLSHPYFKGNSFSFFPFKTMLPINLTQKGFVMWVCSSIPSCFEDTAKMVLRGNLIVVSTYIKKSERPQITW
jgi:hypothetical protein